VAILQPTKLGVTGNLLLATILFVAEYWDVMEQEKTKDYLNCASNSCQRQQSGHSAPSFSYRSELGGC